MSEIKEIVAELIKNGATQVKGVTVKNVTVKVMDGYTRLGITLDKEVKGYRQNEAGEYEEATTKVIFVSSYSVAALLKENDDAAFAANHLVSHPDAMAMILSRAKLDIVQQSVEAGSDYKNPFASETSDSTVFDHNTIINHVVGIELSDFGKKRLDKLADMMLGFNA